MVHRLLPLMLVLGAGCDTQSAPVRPAPGSSGATVPAHNGSWSVQLVDEWGRALPTWHHTGATWVEGVYGRRYNVLVTNHTSERIEVVVTVDGRDVISGGAGDFESQRGYVVDPYGNVTIEGFRRSHSEVAAFRFTNPGDSYSARMGTPQNLGVVGVAVFRESAPPPPSPPPAPIAWGDRDGERAPGAGGAAKNAPAASAPRSRSGAMDSPDDERAGEEQRLGTRYGETRRSSVVDVPFRRRDDRPDAILALYYDDHTGLARRGIIQPAPVYGNNPQPFPESPGQFAPPPPR